MNLKRSIVILLSVILLSSLFSCADGEADVNIDGLYTMTADASSYPTNDRVSLTLYNNTSEDVQFGELFSLYVLKDGAWESVRSEETIKVYDIAHKIKAKSSTLDGALLSVYGNLPAGTYLIEKTIEVTKVDSDGEVHDSEYPIYAVFDLPERDVE